MRTEYGCIFGISSKTGDVKTSQVTLTHKKDRTIAVMPGLEDRPFWFCFFKLHEPVNDIGMPRYTHNDEQRIVNEERSTHVIEETTFGQLYDNALFTTTTALPHHVFEDWYFQRIMLIGDAAHKVSKIFTRPDCRLTSAV